MGEYTGKRYCPSNGTEGMWFTDKFCDNCIHEKFTHTQNHKDKQCEILNDSMIYSVNEEGFPKQWQYDENDKPTCTSFVKWDWGYDDGEGGGFNEPPEPDDPNQLCLPFELEGFELNINMEQSKEQNILVNVK